MTNDDLALILESTNNLLAKIPRDSPRYQPLLEQFKALLQEQLHRCQETEQAIKDARKQALEEGATK